MTTTLTSEKIVAISEKLIKNFTDTGSVTVAFDKTFGEGAYQRLAGELYDELRKKSGLA